MYELLVRSNFSAAHRLVNYQGKCENLHGHNWKVELKVSSAKLNSQGMLIDFKEMKQKLNRVLAALDHSCLNDLAYFKKRNTTSEHIARYIYLELSGLIRKKKVMIKRVTVWETDTSSATYRPNNLTV
ncbi:MAG: 6-carboxytetrahydropterin synthase QueD [Candidatus Omnitrophota bacterium]|nr:6-carboxytetrahydropterin synthase QueD [Candidatus Omnitrophota bacterium]